MWYFTNRIATDYFSVVAVVGVYMGRSTSVAKEDEPGLTGKMIKHFAFTPLFKTLGRTASFMKSPILTEKR